MPTQRKYIEYFDIDKEFYKCVDEAIFNASPTHWQKFYPHEKFIKLLSDVVSVLSGGRSGKESVWVEGAYGTGKSYAVLTLKKLLDVTPDEVTQYFDRYKLSQNLLGKLLSIKHNCKVLSVFRNGSANILSDRDLIVAIQESVRQAMKEKGMVGGEDALKAKGIEWLTDSANKIWFQAKIDADERCRLTGKTVDSIVGELSNSTDRDYIVNLIRKIDEIGREGNANIFQPDISSLLEWIKGIIKDNGLSAIVFIWDEFTEFFKNNRNRLTDFQSIVNLSNVTPFYLIPVTHVSGGLFVDGDYDKKKILGRFIEPTSRIELPDGIAFELIGAALQKNNDELIQKEWIKIAETFNTELKEARQRVANAVGIDEVKMKDILPLHPYAALVLKYLAEKFQSNQRSMFDFIKADNGDDIKAFQWFIKNNGPYDADNKKLLTIDWLWDFFYERGKNELSPEVRAILDAYNRQNASALNDVQKRVFKTILMFIATSRSVNDAQELLCPNKENIRLAFSGTDIGGLSASNIADTLVQEKIIHEKAIAGGKTIYSVATEQVNEGEIELLIEQLRRTKKTAELVEEVGLAEVFVLKAPFRGRFVVESATVDDLRAKVGRFNNQTQIGQYKNKIPVLLCFARDDKESDALFKLIEEESKKPTPSGSSPIVFIDMSHAQLSNDSWVRYLDLKARQEYLRQKNPVESEDIGKVAKGILESWKNALMICDYSIWYIPAEKRNERAANLEDLQGKLAEIDKKIFPLALELHYDVIDNMYAYGALKQGALFGIRQEVSGTYKNQNKPLEMALSGAWGVSQYWENNPSLVISQIKYFIDEQIKRALEISGEVSISALYESLQAPPYGLMNCNITAFILGFALKEYTQNEGEYYSSDGDIDDVLTEEKLRDLIEEVIKNSITPPSRLREKFIKEKSPEEIKFAEATAIIFQVSASSCFVGKIRELLRSKMKTYGFPIWCLREVVDDEVFSVSKEMILDLIEKYVGVANIENYGNGESKEGQLVKEIGSIFIKHASVIDDMAHFIKRDNCLKGMRNYIAVYRGGELKLLSQQIDAGEKYLDSLHEKFDRVDAANWAWNQETAQGRIDDVIIEYKVMLLSREFGVNATSFITLISTWVEKLKQCRISYDAVKNTIIAENILFDMLVTLRKTENISNIEMFLEALETYGDVLRSFFERASSIFKKTANVFLVDLSDEQQDEVFFRMQTDLYATDKSNYLRIVEETVGIYIRNLGRQKLREIWKNKTKTETPFEWSNYYQTPIIALVPQSEISNAKKHFDAINSQNPDKNETEKALNYLENISWWDDLTSQEKRDAAFKKSVSKEYSALISVNEAKKYLLSTVTDEPYYWWSNESVRTKLTELARVKYDTTGAEKALQIINEIGDSDRIKEYFRRLVKANMTIGLEIIGENEVN